MKKMKCWLMSIVALTVMMVSSAYAGSWSIQCPSDAAYENCWAYLFLAEGDTDPAQVPLKLIMGQTSVDLLKQAKGVVQLAKTDLSFIGGGVIYNATLTDARTEAGKSYWAVVFKSQINLTETSQTQTNSFSYTTSTVVASDSATVSMTSTQTSPVEFSPFSSVVDILPGTAMPDPEPTSVWPADSTYTALKTKNGSTGDPAASGAPTFVLYGTSGNVGSPCNLGATNDYRFATGTYAGTWPTGTLTVNNGLQMTWNANITGGARSIYFTSGRWNINDGARLTNVSEAIYVKGAQLWPTMNAHTYNQAFYFGTPTYTGDTDFSYRSALRVGVSCTFNGVVTVVEDTSFTADGNTTTFADFRLNGDLEIKRTGTTFVFTKLTPDGSRTITNAGGATVQIRKLVAPTNGFLTVSNWSTPTAPVTIDATAFGGTFPETATPILKVTNGTLVLGDFVAPEGGMLTLADNGKTLNLSVERFSHTATISENTAWEDIPWGNGVEAPTASSHCKLIISGNPTITFDASAPVTVATLQIEGTGATFDVGGSIPEQTELIFTLPVLTAGMTGTMPTATATGTCEGYDVTAVISATGLTVSGTKETDSVSINFHNGTAISGAGMSGFYPIARDNWSQIIGNAGTLTGLKWVKPDGTVDTAVMSSATATISGTRGYWNLTANSNDPIMTGYIDEVADSTPTVTISGIPFDSFRVIVYMSTDTGNAQFNHVTIDGVDYSAQNGATVSGSTAVWGNAGPANNSLPLAEGTNFLISDEIVKSEFTVIGHRGSEAAIRGCIAAIQIVSTGALLTTTDYTAEVTADENQTWSGQTWAPSLFVDGTLSTATLTFSGDTTFDFDTMITASSVSATGTGLVTLKNNNSSDLSGVALFDLSALADTTTVDFNTGASAVNAGADTIFAQVGTGALAIAEGKKATLRTENWAGRIANAGTLERAYAATGNIVFPGANAVNIYSAGGTDLTLPAPTAGTVMLTGTDSFNFTTINNSGNASSTLTIAAPMISENLFSVGNLTLNIEAGANISTPTFRTADGGGGRTSTINQNGGVLDVTGSTGSNTSTPLTFGHWSGTSLYNLNAGSLFGTNTTVQLGWDAGTVKLTIGNWGSSPAVARFKGVRNDDNRNGAAEINIRGGGRLELGAGGYVTPSNKKIILNGGTFAAYESFSSGSPLYLYAASTVEVPDALTMTLNGVIQRSATDAADEKITKTGTGTLVLGGANTFTNGVVVNEGTVKLTNAAGLGTGMVTVAAGATLDIGMVRPTNAFAFVDGSMLKVLANKLVEKDGTLTLTLADGSSTPTVMVVDGAGAEIAGATDTVSGTTLTITYDPTLTLADLGGANCWHQYSFNGVVTDAGSGNATLNLDGDRPSITPGGFSDYNGDNTALMVTARPWMGITYPTEWTASIYATSPTKANGVILAFGTKDGGTVALIRGAQANQMILARTVNQNTTAYEAMATMTVPNAETTKHLYSFVKRAQSIEIYLDATLWLTYTSETAISFGSGFQIGSVHGGIVGGLSRLDNTDQAVIDELRMYNSALDASSIAVLAGGFPYVSPAGSYTRTVAGGEVNWVEADQWTNGTATFAEPVNGAALTVTATEDSTLTMNLDAAKGAEGLTLAGDGAITFKRSAGAKVLQIDGMTQIGTTVTNGVGAVQMLGPVKIGANKTLAIDTSDIEAFNTIVGFSIRVTGPVTGGTPTFVSSVALPEGWTAAERSATDGYWVDYTYTAPEGAVNTLVFAGNRVEDTTVGIWTANNNEQTLWRNATNVADETLYSYKNGMSVYFWTIGIDATTDLPGAVVSVAGAVSPATMGIGNDPSVTGATGTRFTFVAAPESSDALIQVPNALTIGAAGAGFGVPVAMTHNLTLNGPLTIAAPFGAGVTAASTEGTYNGVISGAGTLRVMDTALTLGGVNTLTGGYVITNATVKMGNGRAFGANAATPNTASVTIQAGGVVDRNGIGDHINNFTLAGGSLVNNGGTMGTGAQQMSVLTVTADSTVGGTGNFGFVNNQYHLSTLTLGENTLTKTGANAFYLINTAIAGTGTIAVNEGTLQLVQAGSVMNDGTLTVADGATLDMGQAFTVKNATINGAITGTARFIVNGMLTATATSFPNLTLNNGATVNVATSTLYATNTLTVAAESTVTVDVTGRTLTVGDTLIAWATQPEGTFTLTGATDFDVEKTDAGLVVKAAVAAVTDVTDPADAAYIAALAPAGATTITMAGSVNGTAIPAAQAAATADLFNIVPSFSTVEGGVTTATFDYTFEIASFTTPASGTMTVVANVMLLSEGATFVEGSEVNGVITVKSWETLGGESSTSSATVGSVEINASTKTIPVTVTGLSDTAKFFKVSVDKVTP